jgi:hypothetical protein
MALFGHQSGLVRRKSESFADAVGNEPKMLGVVDEVQRVGVNGQHRRAVVGFGEEVFVSAVELFDVGTLHVALVGAVAQGDALHEGVGAGAQVDEQVRHGDLLGQGFMDALVHLQFIPSQVDAGEEGVLGEGVIGKQGFAGGDDGRDAAALLVVAAEQEEDLGLEGIAGPVGVEIGEEGVFLEDLEQQVCFECRCEQAGQGGLPDADNTFDGDVHGFNHSRA